MAETITLVSGGSGVLGSAVIRAFLDRGDVVIGVDQNAAGFDRMRKPSGELPQRLRVEEADLTNEESIAGLIGKVLERHGKIDALVNVVGGFAGGQPVWETDLALLDEQLSLNFRTAYLISRAVLPSMVARKSGSIVHVSSRTAVQPAAGLAAYGVAKRAVVSLVEALALETRELGVNVNCVLPSVIDTPANRAGSPGEDFSRWVKPEAIANVIRWLTSEEAAPVSGVALPVYGRA